MKKLFMVLLLAILMGGCSNNAAEEILVTQTASPPEPTTTPILTTAPEPTTPPSATPEPTSTIMPEPSLTKTPFKVESAMIKEFDAGNGSSYQVHWHPTKNLIATTGDKTIHLWYPDEDLDRPIQDAHAGIIRGVQWSPDGMLLASAGDDQFVRVWNDGVMVFEYETASPAYAVSWNQDNILAAATSDGSIYILDIENELSPVILSTGEATNNLSWSPDGGYLAAGVKTGKIFIWDSENFELVHEFYGADLRDPFLNSLKWSPDGQRLASMHDVGEIVIWQVDESGQDVFKQKTTCQLNCLDWSPDGAYLLIGGYTGRVRIISADTGDIVTTLQGPTDLLSGSVGWAPIGSEVVAIYDNYWEFNTEKILQIWTVLIGPE